MQKCAKKCALCCKTGLWTYACFGPPCHGGKKTFFWTNFKKLWLNNIIFWVQNTFLIILSTLDAIFWWVFGHLLPHIDPRGNLMVPWPSRFGGKCGKCAKNAERISPPPWSRTCEERMRENNSGSRTRIACRWFGHRISTLEFLLTENKFFLFMNGWRRQPNCPAASG